MSDENATTATVDAGANDSHPAGKTRRSSVDAWIGADGDYLGVSNVFSLDQMAATIAADEEVCWHLAKYHDVDTSSVERVRAWLDEVDVRPAKVPAATFHNDQWPYEIAVAIDANPGRGYVKVIGVSLA